jgi:hypothetical protein
VFYVLAAFPPGARVDLERVSFGIDYDPDRLVILSAGHCGVVDQPERGWPGPGRGETIGWRRGTRTTPLVEVCWFSGYAAEAADTASFRLTRHPNPDIFSESGSPVRSTSARPPAG